jgi:outer membrane protein TolC
VPLTLKVDIMHRRILLVLLLASVTLIAHNQTKSLDYYLEEGLRNSPLLNEFRNKLSSAMTDSLLISASRKPLIEAKSNLQYSPAYSNFGYDEVITDGGNYMAVMGVSQNIFNKREINNKYEAVTLLKKSVSNASKISELELNNIITAQYLSAYSVYSDFYFNKTLLELIVKENEIVRQFMLNGVCKQTDYLSLIVATQSQEILVTQLKSQYRKDLMLLNQLCGLTDTSSYELTEPLLFIKGTSDVSKTPSYMQYQIDSVRIENEKMAIDIRYKPKVNWFADAGILTSKPETFYKNFGYSVGIGLSVPVYDGKQRGMEKQKLGFEENSRQAYANTYKNQYYSQIQQLKDELRSLNVLSAGLENQMKTSRQLIKALKDQLEAGIIQMTEYINALKNFRTTSRDLNMINIQKFQVINNMNFLLTQ